MSWKKVGPKIDSPSFKCLWKDGMVSIGEYLVRESESLVARRDEP